jgi:hypothetical protein
MNDTPSICAETPADNSFRKISRAAVVFVTLYVWYFSPLGAFGFIGAHPASLSADRARNGQVRGLGDTAALWQAMV